MIVSKAQAEELIAVQRQERRDAYAEGKRHLAGLEALEAVPAWEDFLADLRDTRESFRTALESKQPETETVYLRGQLAILTYILQRPAKLRQEIAELERELEKDDVTTEELRDTTT